MPADLFLRGLVLGFAVAFTLGPIGLLVIRRTIDRGWVFGFVSGIGVATADAAYAAIAAFGLAAITELLVGIDRPLGIIGGLVLIVMAWRALRAALRPAPPRSPGAAGAVAPGAGVPTEPLDGGRSSERRAAGLAGAWLTMAGLTLANPATILSFTALFASIGAGTRGPGGAAAVVAGVFAGSLAWWGILTGLVAGLRTRLTPRVVRSLNVTSALIIGAFGVAAVAIGVAG
jgi:threonine/homoserine/homoserine lactone efflux protein